MAKKTTKSDQDTKPDSGGAKMIAAGRHPVQLGIRAEDLAIIDQARAYEPRASYILRVALEASKKILEERPPAK